MFCVAALDFVSVTMAAHATNMYFSPCFRLTHCVPRLVTAFLFGGVLRAPNAGKGRLGDNELRRLFLVWLGLRLVIL